MGIDYTLDIHRIASRYNLTLNTIIDVGAHTGESIEAFNARWPKARIYALEADPDTYNQLISKPISSRAVCLNLAMSDICGRAQFYRFGNQATCNSLLPANNFTNHAGLKPIGTASVECDTLDNLVSRYNLPRVDLIKIDTEGFEYKILKGARETLATRKVSFVYLEFNRITAQDKGPHGALGPLADILEKLNFSFVATYPELALDSNAYFSTSNALFFRTPLARE